MINTNVVNVIGCGFAGIETALFLAGHGVKVHVFDCGRTYDDQIEANTDAGDLYALEKIAVLENLDATEDEINEEFVRIGSTYGVEVDEVKKMIASEDVKADLLTSKAMTLVKANAVIK